MSDRVQMTFDSPADAAINPKVVIKYGEIRKNVYMHGAFCTSKIQAGEFICAWNGFQVIDDENVDNFINIYDLTKYVISFPGKGGKNIFSCVRLDKNGKPKLPDSHTNDRRDISLAVFLNEPADNEYALYDVRTDSVSWFPKSRNLANVCLRTQPQRKLGIVCPLMFATRDINVGEELVWDYGKLYDRRIYNIDEDNDVFESGVEYKNNTSNDNSCKNTCWTIEFKNKLPVEDFSPDLFLNDDELTSDDIRRINYRSKKYMSAFSDSATHTTEDVEDHRPIKRRKKKTKLKIHSVKQIDVQQQELDDFRSLSKELNMKAEMVLIKIQTLKVTGKTGPAKKAFVELVKNTIQHSVWLEYSYQHPQTQKYISQFFIRPEFCLTEKKVKQFIDNGDSHWKDIMKMQNRFLQNIESMCEKKQLTNIFVPNMYAGMFNSLLGVQESAADWQENSFVDEFPEASEQASLFFDKLMYISDIVDHYTKWDSICTNIEQSRMKACNGLYNTSIETTVYLKLKELCVLGKRILKKNAFETVVEEWVHELVYRILEKGEQFLSKSCLNGTKDIDDLISDINIIFNDFEQNPLFTAEYLDNHEYFQNIKSIGAFNLSWRAESLICDLINEEL